MPVENRGEPARALNIAVLIPAYNEESSIASIISGARTYSNKIVVCDDGSTDKTYKIAKNLGTLVVRHSENRGKGEALRTMLREVSLLDLDVVVTLDGDGQHDPMHIPKLVEPIKSGKSDVVIGSRLVKGGEMNAPIYRTLGLALVNRAQRLLGRVQVKDTQSGFRAFSKNVINLMLRCTTRGYGIESEQLMLAKKNNLRILEVPISVNYQGLRKTSKKRPLLHGIELLLALFRIVLKKNNHLQKAMK